jgi:hypothetical protein
MKHRFLLGFGIFFLASVVTAQSTFDGCPAMGNAVVPRVQQLNLLKNRDTAPKVSDIDPAASVSAFQQLGDDTNRWNPQRGAVFHAYVIDVKPGGKSETANCKVGDPVHRDTHIELVTDPSDNAPERRVVVEVTPRWRAKMLAQGVDWSTSTLKATYLHHWVTVTGWLMFDSEHANESENTAPNGETNWRATAWEIHPITDLQFDEQAAARHVRPGGVRHLVGRVASVDPSGSPLELFDDQKLLSLTPETPTIAAAVKRLKSGDVARAEVTGEAPEAKVTKVEVPVYSVTKLLLAAILLGSVVLLYLLTKALLGRRPIGALVLGLDGRYSNSKFQATLWFGVVITTYLAAVAVRWIGSNHLLVGGVDIPQNLLLLSGLSALSFAGAKVITSNNVKKPEADTRSKTTAAPTPQPAPAAAAPNAPVHTRSGVPTKQPSFPGDLVNDDYGVLSLARFQIMVITFVAVAVYVARVVAVFTDLPLTATMMLPDVDTTILAAFGLGQGAYLTNKVVSPES